MSSMLQSLLGLSGYHILSWGSLVGMQLYQTFVMTKLAYVYLLRSQFVTLQRKVFPIYFAAETILVITTALTYPAGSVVGLLTAGQPNRRDLIFLSTALLTSTLNVLVYGPRTISSLAQRSHQETRENLRLAASLDMARDEMSPEMYQAKRAFSFNHAMSIHLNLLSLLTTVAYGFSLSSRITVG